MPLIDSPYDGARLHYVDYRPAPEPYCLSPTAARSKNVDRGLTLFFIHGWPMSSQMYSNLMVLLSSDHGIRCIASDRRGFGKSEWTGPRVPAAADQQITYDVFASDTVAIIKSIPDLDTFTFVASSMGCGETVLVYRLLQSQNLAHKCRGFLWLGPSLPSPFQTPAYPLAYPREFWNDFLASFRNDRIGFIKASIGGNFGTDQGIQMRETALERYVDIIKQADPVALEQCVQIISRYDFTPILKTFGDEKPDECKVVILHGDKDRCQYAPKTARVDANRH